MKKITEIKKKMSAWFCRYINGTKGAISLLLAILMVPFVTIAGILINAARINSAVAIFDEALCNASNSTLGTYDTFLRSRFGLLAISQDYSDKSEGYTAEDFLEDTFQFYMEQNCLALSNTYNSMTVSAAGVYPLADTDVLLSQVLENGKYSVPLKLAIDGFNLDDILGVFTGKLKTVSNVFKLVSSGADTVTAYDDLNEKLKKLTEEINSCLGVYSAYETAFSEFEQAVIDYNNLVDERNREVGKCENAVSSAESTLRTRQSEFDTIAAKHAAIIAELEALKNEKDSNGNPVDNSKKIKELEEEYEEELEEYRTAETNLKNAKTALTTAQTNLTNTKARYENLLSQQRTTISNKQSTYVTKIGELMTALQDLNSAITSAQTAAATVISKGADTMKGLATTGVDIWNGIANDDIEDLTAQRDAAEKEGNAELVADYNAQIAEKQAQYDEDKIVKGDVLAMLGGQDTTDSVTDLEDFAERTDYTEYLVACYSSLETLKTNVSKVEIPEGLSKMGSVTDYFVKFELPITVKEVEDLLDGLLGEALGSSFLTVIKSIAGFISAMFELVTEIGHDDDLESAIDTSLYDNIGGLPSSRSQDSFASEYAEQDKEQSDKYKAILNSYSEYDSEQDPEYTISTAIDELKTSISKILEVINRDDWGIWTFIDYIGEIWDAVCDIVATIGNVVVLALQMVGETLSSAYAKMLLIGYVGYNTSNRTTYEASALTGAAYAASLPSTKDQNAGGYAFYGAETEYILYGSLSETTNQRLAFFSIFVMRLLYDIPLVFGNGEVQAVASGIAAVTFGILYTPVIILWGVAEAFLDTTFLCHGGDIKYVKTKVYLSVAGMDECVKQIAHISLSDSMRDKLSSITATAYVGRNADGEEMAEIRSKFYAGLNEAGQKPTTTDKIKSAVTFDYTKVLMLYMLFVGSDTMLKRLSDIIQMEATWNERKTKLTTNFDLGQSYTYLRASGSFTSSQFIQIAEGDLSSTERIVYRGY